MLYIIGLAGELVSRRRLSQAARRRGGSAARQLGSKARN